MIPHADDDIRYRIVAPDFNEEAVLPVLPRRRDLPMSALDGLSARRAQDY
jgi:hypothetical protein